MLERWQLRPWAVVTESLKPSLGVPILAWYVGNPREFEMRPADASQQRVLVILLLREEQLAWLIALQHAEGLAVRLVVAKLGQLDTVVGHT